MFIEVSRHQTSKIVFYNYNILLQNSKIQLKLLKTLIISTRNAENSHQIVALNPPLTDKEENKASRNKTESDDDEHTDN